MPVGVGNVRQGVLGRHIDDAALGVLGQEAHNGDLGADGLAGAGGRAHKNVLVPVVDGVEDLGLDGVELGELVLVDVLVVLVSAEREENMEILEEFFFFYKDKFGEGFVVSGYGT